MKYKVGDKVRIKSLDWYNENKDAYGHITFCREDEDDVIFDTLHSEYCGEILTIEAIVYDTRYLMIPDIHMSEWTDEMIECKVEEETKPKFKVGDKIISDVFTTKDDKGWEVIDVERTGYKLISVNNPDLICDMDFKNEHYYKLVEEKCYYVQANNIPDVIQSKTSSVCSHNGFYGYSDSEGNETSEWYLPDGYQFVDENGNVINAMKIVLEKKKKEYPKTYEECCKILDISPIRRLGDIGYKRNLINNLEKLLVCRDAYWKIAGDEMGLGKPWKPDWKNSEMKYTISFEEDEYTPYRTFSVNCPFAFSTEEMRDAFYENFKEFINEVKELL